MNRRFWKIKVVVFRQRSSVVEHSTADRMVGGSISLALCLRILGRVKQPCSIFLENQTSKIEQFLIGKKKINMNCRGCAMNIELQVPIKAGSSMPKCLSKLSYLVRSAPLKAPATAQVIFMSLITFLRR